MQLYYRNPGSSIDFVLDGSRFRIDLRSDNDLPDGAIIESHIRHIRNKALVVISRDSGDVVFRGVVISSEYNAYSSTRKYECMSSEGLLQRRYAPRYRYPGGTGLYLSDVLASDAPPQAAGDNQYVMGLLWLALSKVPDGLASWDETTGTATLEGWDVPASGHDIYYDGHKLTASTLSAITGGTYRYAVSGGNLYVRGAGAGDCYGVVCIDGFSENFVRLGTVATDSEIESAYPIDHQPVWDLVRDLVAETGQYVVIRREEDYVYLDVAAAPASRGSEASPYVQLREGEDFSFSSMPAPQHFPSSAVIGLGADYEEVWGQRYGAGIADGIGRAWIEETYAMDGARVDPYGHLDAAVDDYFDGIQAHAPVSVDLYHDGLLVGDWCEFVLMDGETFTIQLQALEITEAIPQNAIFGAQDLNLRSTFWEREESDAIEAYRENLETPAEGEAVRYSYFGPTESISIEFETIDFDGADARILLFIEVVDENDADELNAAVNYKITINGDVVRIPWDAWGPQPITEFDLGPWLKKDGTTETLLVELDGYDSWIADDYVFMITVSGLGADNPPEAVTLDIDDSILNDMSTSTKYYTESESWQSHYDVVEDLDCILSTTMTVKIWNRIGGFIWQEETSDPPYYINHYAYARTMIYVGGTWYYGSDNLCNTTKWVSTTYTENPKTSAAWTLNDINGLQAGGQIKVTELGTYWLNEEHTLHTHNRADLFDAYIEVLP